jgi:hypothetical protein
MCVVGNSAGALLVQAKRQTMPSVLSHFTSSKPLSARFSLPGTACTAPSKDRLTLNECCSKTQLFNWLELALVIARLLMFGGDGFAQKLIEYLQFLGENTVNGDDANQSTFSEVNAIHETEIIFEAKSFMINFFWNQFYVNSSLFSFYQGSPTKDMSEESPKKDKKKKKGLRTPSFLKKKQKKKPEKSAE